MKWGFVIVAAWLNAVALVGTIAGIIQPDREVRLVVIALGIPICIITIMATSWEIKNLRKGDRDE